LSFGFSSVAGADLRDVCDDLRGGSFGGPLPFALFCVAAATAAAVVAPFAIGAPERLVGLGLAFGFGFVGEPKSMRGTFVPVVVVVVVVVVEPSRDCRLMLTNLRCAAVLSIWLFREELFESEKGPSSTIQSLRSMSEDFLPRIGGDGDGDEPGGAVTGRRDAVAIAGGGGDSRKSTGLVSKADIRAWTDIKRLGQEQMPFPIQELYAALFMAKWGGRLLFTVFIATVLLSSKPLENFIGSTRRCLNWLILQSTSIFLSFKFQHAALQSSIACRIHPENPFR